MLTGLERLDRQIAVRAGGRADNDRIDRGIGERGIQIVKRLAAMLFGERSRAAGHAIKKTIQFDIRQLAHCRDVTETSDTAAADDQYIYHGNTPLKK